jgi:hypothetical protein
MRSNREQTSERANERERDFSYMHWLLHLIIRRKSSTYTSQCNCRVQSIFWIFIDLFQYGSSFTFLSTLFFHTSECKIQSYDVLSITYWLDYINISFCISTNTSINIIFMRKIHKSYSWCIICKNI